MNTLRTQKNDNLRLIRIRAMVQILSIYETYTVVVYLSTHSQWMQRANKPRTRYVVSIVYRQNRAAIGTLVDIICIVWIVVYGRVYRLPIGTLDYPAMSSWFLLTHLSGGNLARIRLIIAVWVWCGSIFGVTLYRSAPYPHHRSRFMATA